MLRQHARGHARDSKAPRNRIGIQDDARQLKVTVNPTTLTPWSAHDTQLLIACALGLAIIIISISVLKLAPFLSILVGTFAAGFAAHQPLEAIAQAFSKGAGALLGDVGIIIALGAMLGALMAESGAADRLVTTLLDHSTPRRLPWMMAFVAIIVGLPLFFEVGLVMMVPIIFVMARRAKQPILRIAIPALAGMTTLHALLPPHPGPLIAVSALHADLGLTLGLGLIVALPAVMLAGPLYGIWLSKRLHIEEPEDMGKLFTAHEDGAATPGFAISLVTILLPVVMMLGRTVAKLALTKDTLLYNTLDFVGEPLVALALTVLFAIVMLGWSRGMARERVGGILRKSLPPIARSCSPSARAAD
jgi:GntP family gluconate:H+ symporter